MTSWTCSLTLVALLPHPALAQTPKFEVASVKPAVECQQAGRGGRGSGAGVSPDTLELKCMPLSDLVFMAYVQFADGKQRPPGGAEVPISGGPSWVRSDRYDIEAKADGAQTREMMRGPMLVALLEDRFKLKVRRESKEVPVYALTVARGGPKLTPAEGGKCIPREQWRTGPRTPGKLSCGVFAPIEGGTAMFSTTLGYFCDQLSVVMDRPVVDRTGIAGLFDIYIAAPPEAGEPASADVPPGPRPRASLTDALVSAVLDAIQKVGLKLESAKGPGEFLVIDSVERPSAN